jgi:hypothetical protein
LRFHERSLTVTLNQLFGDQWAFGVRYRLSRAQLRDRFPEIPLTIQVPAGFSPDRRLSATLHQLALSGIYTHPSGLFAQTDALWDAQDNHGYAPPLRGDDFWQFNIFAGCRFLRRRAEVRLGLLNIGNQDYRLNPLNLTSELPRKRTIIASLRLSF